MYQQIVEDLKEAQNLLADGYTRADGITLYAPNTAERIRPCRSAATALLARTYLFMGDYANAELESTSIIDNVSYYSLAPLNQVFLKNSKEAIWQLQPVTNGLITNTAQAYKFILTVPPRGINSSHPVYLSTNLLNSFEPGDRRGVIKNWLDSIMIGNVSYYFSYKYKDVTAGIGVSPTEYTTVLRLGEQYLIRAESRAQLNKISQAVDDINVIRSRAGLTSININDKTSLLKAILHERQVELFTEFGNRWLDLKRTGAVDSVMAIASSMKGGAWKSFQKLYPIPFNDIQRNPNLEQNPEYP